MRPLHAVSWKKIARMCKEEGCLPDRERCDHYIMVKKGLKRPIVIPKRKDLKEDIVLTIGRTLGLSKADILDRLKNQKSRKGLASN